MDPSSGLEKRVYLGEGELVVHRNTGGASSSTSAASSLKDIAKANTASHVAASSLKSLRIDIGRFNTTEFDMGLAPQESQLFKEIISTYQTSYYWGLLEVCCHYLMGLINQLPMNEEEFFQAAIEGYVPKLQKIVMEFFVKGYLSGFNEIPDVQAMKQKIADVVVKTYAQGDLLAILDSIDKELPTLDTFRTQARIKFKILSRKGIETYVERKKPEKILKKCEKIQQVVGLLKTIFRMGLFEVVIQKDLRHFKEYENRIYTDSEGSSLAAVRELLSIGEFVHDSLTKNGKILGIGFEIAGLFSLLRKIIAEGKITQESAQIFPQLIERYKKPGLETAMNMAWILDKLATTGLSSEEYCQLLEIPSQKFPKERMVSASLARFITASLYLEFFWSFDDIFTFARTLLLKLDTSAAQGVYVSYYPLVSENPSEITMVPFSVHCGSDLFQKFDLDEMIGELDQIYASNLAQLEEAFNVMEQDRIIGRMIASLKGETERSNIVTLKEFLDLKNRTTSYCTLGRQFLENLSLFKVKVIERVARLIAKNPGQFSSDELASLDLLLAEIGANQARAIYHLVLANHLDHLFVDSAQEDKEEQIFPHLDEIIATLIFNFSKAVIIPAIQPVEGPASSNIVPMKELTAPIAEPENIEEVRPKTGKGKAPAIVETQPKKHERSELFKNLKQRVLKELKFDTPTEEILQKLALLDIFFSRKTGSHIICTSKTSHKNVVIPKKKSLPPGTFGSIKKQVDAAAVEESRADESASKIKSPSKKNEKKK